MVRMKLEGSDEGIGNLIKDFEEPLETVELRMNITSELKHAKAKGSEAIEKFREYIEYTTMSNQINTTNKKLNRARQEHNAFLPHGIKEDPEYGLVDGGGDYDSVTGYSNGLLHNKAESLVTSCFSGDCGIASF